MKLSIIIELDEKQRSAYTKRITGNDTPESLGANIITEQAQKWAEDDYRATSLMLVEKLQALPQETLDGITDQLLKLAE